MPAPITDTVSPRPTVVLLKLHHAAERLRERDDVVGDGGIDLEDLGGVDGDVLAEAAADDVEAVPLEPLAVELHALVVLAAHAVVAVAAAVDQVERNAVARLEARVRRRGLDGRGDLVPRDGRHGDVLLGAAVDAPLERADPGARHLHEDLARLRGGPRHFRHCDVAHPAEHGGAHRTFATHGCSPYAGSWPRSSSGVLGVLGRLLGAGLYGQGLGRGPGGGGAEGSSPDRPLPRPGCLRPRPRRSRDLPTFCRRIWL